MKKTQQRKYRSTAYSIGRQLVRKAIWSPDGRCNWQGDVSDVIRGREKVFSITFKGDMYLGLSGIALFLGELSAYIKDSMIRETLHGTIKNILDQHEEKPLERPYSFFGGQLGVGWTLWYIGHLTNNSKWEREGLRIIANLEDIDLQAEELDIMNGAAGAIPVFLQLYKNLKKPLYLKLADKCGQFLLNNAIEGDEGMYWLNSHSDMGLTGYSHGAAGFTTALLDLAHYTKNETYKTAAFSSFQFEQKHFVNSANNWQDLRLNRDKPNEPLCGKSWCHGAPGIALSYLKNYQLTEHQPFLDAARIGLETTYQATLQSLENIHSANFSLCHGLSGNALILYHSGIALNNTEYVEMAYKIADQGIKLYEATRTNWPSGVSATNGKMKEITHTPGLMLGDAGIGYYYLQLAKQGQLTNMLLL